MIVKISNYGEDAGKRFIEYNIKNLNQNQIDFLKNNLDEEIISIGGDIKLIMYFEKVLYPFQSEIAKMKIDDYIAREEIEMNVFLSSFLEDI